MENTTENGSDLCHLRPEGEMTIYTADELKGRLVAALGQCKELEIDLSQVSEMDTAGLQLLVLAKREAAAKNKTLRLIFHSPAVVETLDLCNMSRAFGDPIVIQSHAA